MSKAITFGALEKILLDAGFTYKRKPGSHVFFRHPDFDATLVLPTIRRNERVSPAHMAAVRKTLIDKGVLDETQFDKLLP